MLYCYIYEYIIPEDDEGRKKKSYILDPVNISSFEV